MIIDDILWYALAAIAGAELYGNTAMLPDGVSYLKLAENTYNQVYEQYSTTCGGGIYWSRDRFDPNSSKAGYKSTISNAQQLMLGSRLYLITQNETYLKHASTLYNWLKTSGIVNNGHVYDGINANLNCVITIDEHSYIAGIVII